MTSYVVLQLIAGEAAESDDRIKEVDVLVEGATSPPLQTPPPLADDQLNDVIISGEDLLKGAESDGEEKKDEEKPIVETPPAVAQQPV